MWGRAAGLLFAAPLGYLNVKRALRPVPTVRLTGLLGLRISEAFVGWWMVRSGMESPEQTCAYIGAKPAAESLPLQTCITLDGRVDTLRGMCLECTEPSATKSCRGAQRHRRLRQLENFVRLHCLSQPW